MTRMLNIAEPNPSQDLLSKVQGPYSTILADPPWQFQNRTGKVAPEHKRLLRYPTMELKEIMELPVSKLAAAKSHLYLWVPNALLEGNGGMGVYLQIQSGMVQGAEGWRARWKGSGVLFP
ncbi:MAG: MT-A70 family methyltransferase [Chlorobium sp.]